MEILCFLLGMLCFYTHAKICFILILLLMGLRPHWKWLLFFLLAVVYGAYHQWSIMDRGMPRQDSLAHVVLIGSIASIPVANADRTKFEFSATELNHHPIKAHLQMNCYKHCPSLHVGERWSLTAKIHRIHNYNNPGSFDYKTVMAARHIQWGGYVLNKSMHALESSPKTWNLLRLREYLAGLLGQLITDEQVLGVTQALSIGVTAHLDPTLWQLFRCTGTTHLMVISGAHIGLIAGMMFKFVFIIWSRIRRVCLLYPAQQAASWVAIFSGGAYALIAGLGIPAERAVVASALVFFRYLGQRHFSAWQAWRYALLAVLLSEPHAVLMPGFYLSFMAVAVLLTVNRRLMVKGIRKLAGIQCACMLGLLPLTLLWFSYGSLSGLIANIIAIPWVSFVVVPLSLLTLIVGQYSVWLLKLLNMAIHFLLYFLQEIDKLSGVNIEFSYPNVFLPCMLLLALTVLLLLPVKILLPIPIILLIAAFYPAHPKIPAQAFHAHVLDVGQGLAVVIQTHRHTLIYDTGGQIYHGTDMGSAVIVPFLKQLGIQHLDAIVISHPDLDHRGGLATLEKNYPIDELIVDNPAFYHRGLSCHHHPDWTWEGVHFHFFPLSSQHASTNNRSCVLQISNSSGKLLLAGDIEEEAEQELRGLYAQELPSRVLIVPHHGSKTSSSLDFLRVVDPEYAVFSYGLDNRYHFPHAIITQRYHQEKIKLYATADQGMISLLFLQENLKINTFLK